MLPTVDPLVPAIVAASITIFFLSFLLRYFKMPNVIIYILVGVILGPYFFNILGDIDSILILGNLGVILLLFFIGMEISLGNLLRNWKVAFFGTIFQILLSVGIVFLLGHYLNWPFQRSLLIGFVISLSSTAVVIKILESTAEKNKKIRDSLIGILVVQDIMTIPMIIILSFFSSSGFDISLFLLQVVGMIFFLFLVFYILIKKSLKFKLLSFVKKDYELQIFTALGICFGFAFLSAIFGLSSALGSFVAGIIVSSIKEIDFFSKSLSPFYVVFVALFFVSVGLLININFLLINWKTILFLTLIIYVVNTVINTIILRYYGLKLKESIYSALLLSHIGEFSFVLIAIGLSNGIITEYGYNLVISVISLSLLISPIVLFMFRVLVSYMGFHGKKIEK